MTVEQSALTLRRAASSDLDAIAHVVYDDPEPPLVTMLGSRDRARRVGHVLVRHGLEISIPQATVAVIDGRVAGVMECGAVADRALLGRALAALPSLIAAVGPLNVPGVLSRYRYRGRTQFDAVPGAFPVGALYVAEDFRNRGIGAALLRHADELARDGGHRLMSIETGITNPARRLYERHGFMLHETKADADYKRVTGSPGRVLMLKTLE